MLVTELLQTLTRVFFVLLAVLTVIDYLRHRDPIRRDVALVFVSLASSIVISILVSITGLQAPWVSKIGQIGLVSQPFLLLRLVGYFRPIPRVIYRLALAGWAVSCVVLILFSTPLPAGVTLPILVYFIVINGYSVSAFIRGAFSSSGVTRNRLRFASMGSALLVILFIVAGLRLFIPNFWGDALAAIQLMSMLTVLTYYLGFAPPRWLRQGWQFAELRTYLLDNITKTDNKSASAVLSQLRQAVIRSMGTQNVFVALWDDDNKALMLEENASTSALANAYLNEGIIRRVWQDDQPTTVYKRVELGSQDMRLLQVMKAETLFIVPIATQDTPLGVLLVFLEYGSLFADDDLSLLNIFAQQTAIFLENYNVMEQQRRYARDLEVLVKQRTQALQSSNDELRQFAYVASHDLQEPLRMVVSYLQLIEDRYISKIDDEAREFIGFAVDGAKRMKSLIEALLAYSRVETKTQNFTPVNMEKTVGEVVKLMKVSIEEKGATITTDGTLPQIQANEAMMIQLFQNLISNGIKYQKNTKPEVHVGAVRTGSEWTFSVRDNGIGIGGKDLERIFVIFQRLHAGTEYPGTGIGLAVCKKVVEHHGGRIWAESAVGVGTTFYFTIPA